MFNGSEETNIILQDTLLTGITDVSFDYQVEEEAVLLLANRGINRKINKASSASCSISKKCIGRDFIQELTGYANLSGQFIYGTGGLDFDQATITNYKISLSPQDIPTLSADLKIYGDLKPATGLRLNSSYADNSGENFGPTSIVFNINAETEDGRTYAQFTVTCNDGRSVPLTAWDGRRKWCVGEIAEVGTLSCDKKQISAAKTACMDA